MDELRLSRMRMKYTSLIHPPPPPGSDISRVNASPEHFPPFPLSQITFLQIRIVYLRIAG